jgi:hypothetical protein
MRFLLGTVQGSRSVLCFNSSYVKERKQEGKKKKEGKEKGGKGKSRNEVMNLIKEEGWK